MVRYRIVAFTWFVLGVAGFLLSAVECLRLLHQGEPFSSGSVVSTLIGLVFCIFSATAGLGLLRSKRWTRAFVTVLAALLIFYCLIFLLMIGLRFGVVATGACLLGLTIGCYTLLVIWILKPPQGQSL